MISKIKKLLPVSVKQNLKEYKYKAIKFFFDFLEPLIGRFVVFHTRPMSAKEVFIDPRDVDYDYSEYAIVVQGPVRKRNNFTLETLLLYKRFFPNAMIILSTHEGGDDYYIKRAKEAGVEVIISRRPKELILNRLGRHKNINLQMISSMAGIRLAMEAKKKYTLKIRTDERIYNHNSLIFLSNLLKRFPITVPNCRQKGRLIAINNTMRKLYYFPDPLAFGYTEDVALYYGADFILQSRPLVMTPYGLNAVIKIGSLQIPFAPEHYFFTEFLKKIGYEFEGTLEDSLRALAKHTILIDGATSLDWYFYKYNRFLEYRPTYKQRNYMLGFAEWFNLYCRYEK